MARRIGTHVRVSEGAGLDSNREGIIISPRSSAARPATTIGSQGRYSSFDSKREFVIREKNGNVFSMFKNYISEVKK